MEEELDFPEDITVMFRPAMQPLDRGDYEDEIEDALEELNLGEVIGGGTAMDGTFCDISVCVSNLEEGIRVIREVLQRCEAPESTILMTGGPDDRVEHPVYPK